MRQQQGTEGLRAPLFRLAVVILVAAGSGASAQTVELDELRRCAALETGEQKLACFERLAESAGTEPPADTGTQPVAGGDDEGDVDDAAPVPDGPAVTDEPSVDAAVPAPPAESAPDAGPIRALAPGVEVDPYPGPQPDVEAAKAGEPATEAAAPTEPDDEFGRRYIDEPEEDGEPGVVTATINEVSRGRHRILYFHFANGQLWRQMEPGYFAYPKDGSFEVEIRQGMMGDYQMRVDGKGRMTRIVRVR